MESFKYEPLAIAGGVEIRLLELRPGSGSEELRCEIRHVQLSEELIYDAVSYCWGDPSEIRPVICNGTLLNITRNLHSFLSHTRHSSETKTIWADAICIDQTNLEERSIQVQHMRSIYSNARTVFVWLGTAVEGSDRAIELAKHLARLNPQHVSPLLSFDAVGVLPISDEAWAHLGSLFNRPYFGRAWVVQEVAMSCQVIVLCGSSSISWETLYQTLIYLEESRVALFFRGIKKAYLSAMEMARDENSRGINCHPLSVLLRYRNSQATDPRDHVFAFFGLLQKYFEDISLKADYGLDPNTVYHRLAVEILRKDRNLDIFTVTYGATRGRMTIDGLPSWVPDWSHSTAARSLLRAETGATPYPFETTKDSVCTPQFSVDQRRLGVEGFVFDKVTHRSKLIFDKDPFDLGNIGVIQWYHSLAQNMKKELRLFWHLKRAANARSKKKYCNGESMIDVFWMTLRAGYIPEGYQEAKELFDKFDQSTRYLRGLVPLSYIFPVYFLLTVIFGISAIIRKRIFGIDEPLFKSNTGFFAHTNLAERRIFRTRSGYVGLGPALTAVGDSIALCKGGKLPLVIREVGEDWELVGDCYIRGVIYGQRYEEDKCQNMWFV